MNAPDLRRRFKRQLGEVVGRVTTNDRARCLVYHDVVQSEERDAGQMTVSATLFAKHLDTLTAAGYRVIDALWAAKEIRAGRALPRRSVVLTFDDGLAGARLAGELLAERGLSATLFVTPGIVDGSARTRRATLDRTAIRSLLGMGAFTLGAHGATHVALTTLTDAELEKETAGARRELADWAGVDCDLFAYPFGSFGSWDGRARSTVERAGYAAAFTSVYGTLGGDLYALPRCRVSWAEDTFGFQLLLAGAYDWYRWIQWMQSRPVNLR